MRIKFCLVKCHITSDPDDRKAQVSGYEIVTEKELFEHMTRAGSAITLAEAKANYEEIIGTLEYFLKLGYGINTEFIHIRPVIQGLFHGDDDKFEHGRHKIRFRSQLGKRYNRTADDVKVEKIDQEIHLPVPVTFEDVISASINNMITLGGVASLTGQRLNFKQDDIRQGVFLIDSSNKEYRMERIISHTGKQIVFQIPADIIPDVYTLEVRAILSGGKI